jgi:hypothetical protein
MTSGMMGDGDSLGIALRMVDPGGWDGSITHANVATNYDQFDPDVVFTGSEVSVAWVDESQASNKLDIYFRRFSPALAVLDMAAPGAVTPFDIPAGATVSTAAGRPTLVRVGKSAFLGWEAPAPAPALPGRHVWLKELAWGTSLDLAKAEIPLAREARYRTGDQERAALASATLAPFGGLLASWVDLSKSFANTQGDVAVELAPIPLTRLP